MPTESQIPIASQGGSKRFATRLALFYGTTFGTMGTHLPFFTVWLKAVGIDASWIGIISAVPSLTRFTVLPFVTSAAEKRYSLRGALTVTAFATALGFALIGTQYLPLAVLLAYAATCSLWTPMVPLTDAYALRGVARYGLKYGPLRLWGSAAFVVGALVCGLLVDIIAARQLIWVIASVAALGAFASLGLQPLDRPKPAAAAVQGAKPFAARSRFPRHHPCRRPDPGQPRRLLHLCLHHLAGVGSGRADHCRAVGAGRAGRDRGVRAVAALHAGAGAIGGDRRAQCGGALADHRAGAVGCGAVGGSARAWADLWTDPGRHHGAAGASRAGPYDGARAGLSRGLRRHRHQHGIDPVGHRLCQLRAGRLLRDGRDGAGRRDRDVVLAEAAKLRAKRQQRINPRARLPADKPVLPS